MLEYIVRTRFFSEKCSGNVLCYNAGLGALYALYAIDHIMLWKPMQLSGCYNAI